MQFVKATNFFGIIIRKDAISKKSLSIDDIKKLIETDLIDESDELLSFGPCFGEEAADNIGKKLITKGLQYVDDYFIFQGDFPDWMSFKVGLNRPNGG
jgi:hypothetical protein